MQNINLKNKFDEISLILAKIDSKDDIYNFMRDLLSENEMIEISNRFNVAKMLNNKLSYKKIEEITWMSSTTIARISKFLNSDNSWYNNAISILQSILVKHHEFHQS